MIITNTKKLSKIAAKLAAEPTLCDLHITPKHVLRLSSSPLLATTDYAIALGGEWFCSSGLRNSASREVPENGVPICKFAPGMFVAPTTGTSVEFVNKKHPASRSFYCFVYAKLPSGILLITADGAISPTVHTIMLRDSSANEAFAKSVVSALARPYITDFPSCLEALYVEEEKEI